ncbi:MAG: flagellin [Lachnospiraceae bacterium]|nr:flagellin [Candidatus Merdinaster equi]
MVVQHNLQAMNSNRMLNVTTSTQSKLTEQLSSGYKINRAADDAAGLTISEKMRSQIRGLTQASANAEDGISAVQTAEGALAEAHDMLQRMNELVIKAANGTNTTADRVAIGSELDQLTQEIGRINDSTTFNTLKLFELNGTGVVQLQVGASASTSNQIELSIDSITATKLGISTIASTIKNAPVGTTGTKSCNECISKITKAIAKVSANRSHLGAIQNRLEHTIKNLDNVVENTTAAESSIRDTDMASAMVQFSNSNILAQAGQSMLAQANSSNQGVLSLLG